MRIPITLVLMIALQTAASATDVPVSDLPRRFNAIVKATGQKLRMVQKECLPNGPVYVCTEAIGSSLSAIVSARDDRKTISDITLMFHAEPRMDEWVTATAAMISVFSPEIDKETKATAFMSLISTKPDGSLDNVVTFDSCDYRLRKINDLGLFLVVDPK